MSLVGRGVLTTPPFTGPFCRPVSAQSTTQPWRAETLTPMSSTTTAYVELSTQQSYIHVVE